MGVLPANAFHAVSALCFFSCSSHFCSWVVVPSIWLDRRTMFEDEFEEDRQAE